MKVYDFIPKLSRNVVKALKLKSVTSCQEGDLKTGLVRATEIPLSLSRQGR